MGMGLRGTLLWGWRKVYWHELYGTIPWCVEVVGLDQAAKQVLLQAGNPLKVYLKIPPMPVHNLKCTKHTLNIYAPPVTLSFFKEKRYLWCRHAINYLKVDGQEVYLALPPFSIVWYYYSSGSWKHTYVSFSKLFYVSQISMSETVLDSEKGLKLSHETLAPLPEGLRNFEKVQAEMEVEGFSLTQRYPNINVNAYRILRLVRDGGQPQPTQAQSTSSISGRVSSISFSFQGGGREG
jgi:hypothetical protein